jgi:hypothetical protein
MRRSVLIRGRPGHKRLWFCTVYKTWMPEVEARRLVLSLDEVMVENFFAEDGL